MVRAEIWPVLTVPLFRWSIGGSVNCTRCTAQSTGCACAAILITDPGCAGNSDR
eukprot:SAG31_NODE_27780_length_420_cov_0.866044_1_plen_53_part_10